MNTEEIQFHSLVVGVFVAILVAMSIIFIRQSTDDKQKLFHRMMGVLSLGTLVLIFVGAMVASTRSGMAFMDWPTSNGLIWPGLDKWIHQKDMFWEHFHRLIAEGIGFLAICTLIWSFFVHDKKYVKPALILLLVIIIQGIFGGLTVKRMTAWWTSSLHGVVAQLVLAYMSVLFFSTAKSYQQKNLKLTDDSWLIKLPKIVCVVVLLQLILGASFRHKMKVANFASELDNEQVEVMASSKAHLIFRQKGKVTIKVKARQKGALKCSLQSPQMTSQEVSKNIDSLGEYINIGEVDADIDQAYSLQLSEPVDSVQLVTKERITFKGMGEEKELPFSIVYKEVLKGNKHLLWAHVGFAIVVTVFVLLLGMYLMKKDHGVSTLKSLGKCMLISLIVQLLLGLVALLTVSDRQRDVYDQVKTILTSAHLANGAVLLVFCVLVVYVVSQHFTQQESQLENKK